MSRGSRQSRVTVIEKEIGREKYKNEKLGRELVKLKEHSKYLKAMAS